MLNRVGPLFRDVDAMHAQLTLYDDWRDRAARLQSGAAQAEPFELRILNFLLRRYQHAPEAERPSRGPAGAGVVVNDRAIIVHHHLRMKETTDVKSRKDAVSRVHAILGRMSGESPAPAPSATINAVQLQQNRWVNHRRVKLADPNPLKRIAAAHEVGMYGDLEDIGLLMDLLALPVTADEDPRERDALRSAIEQLSRAAPRMIPRAIWRRELPQENMKAGDVSRREVAVGFSAVLAGLIHGAGVGFWMVCRASNPPDKLRGAAESVFCWWLCMGLIEAGVLLILAGRDSKLGARALCLAATAGIAGLLFSSKLWDLFSREFVANKSGEFGAAFLLLNFGAPLLFLVAMWLVWDAVERRRFDESDRETSSNERH